MYDVYHESGEKAFGCSSLSVLAEYMKDVGVLNAVVTPKNPGGREVRVNLCFGEYIIVDFGNSIAADVWIQVWIPGTPIEVISKEDRCIYEYK